MASLQSNNTEGGKVSETLSRSYSERSSDRREISSSRDYESLKQQCDKAIHELQLLRRQNNETNRRCEHTMKEMEYYRNQHHAAMSQLEVAAQESSTLRLKYGELISEKQRLEREMADLRSKFCNQEVMGENGSNEAFNNHYITTINKYETLKENYETLRQQYDDLIASHTTAMDKFELTQEELGRLKQQIDEMIKERNNAIRERNGLKHQCTQAIRQWDMTVREKNELQEAIKKIQQQNEEAMEEINRGLTFKMKTCNDVKRLTEERNAALQEYSLIMSERDTVHKEMEKLSEDLTQAYKRIKILENEAKDHLEEKKMLCYHIETYKREIASALHDRDKALKECNDFRERFGELAAKEESREAFISRFDYSYNRERDSTRKNTCELQASSMDLFSKCQKERMDNLDQANQEIERLRKCLDKQQTELQEALQEAEVSKRRRDWAFNERDKIVLERESIRTLCDRLRKERDRAVSDLAEALRDSDDIKRQRNETTKELKFLKEKMEARIENESMFTGSGKSSPQSYSRNSDLQEWDTEIMNMDAASLSNTQNLGLELVGGRDDPYYPNDSGIYVSSVSKGSILEGKLKPNDCILRVNNLDCSNVSKRMVMETVHSSITSCVIMAKRRRIGARSMFTTQLQLNNYDHGLTLETGIYICRIAPGSLAAKEGNLAVGDRILNVNNKPMEGLKSGQEAMAILNQPTDVLTITSLKSTFCSRNCGNVSNRDIYRKYTNSSTQTDQRYYFSRYDERPLYSMKDSHKPPSKWDTIKAKDLIRGRRFSSSKSSSGEKKQQHQQQIRNSSPVTFDQEKEDALAELDSVIDSCAKQYRRGLDKVDGGIRKGGKEMDKNGGTWPKARVGPIIQHVTGTILHPRKRKERLPLSMLLSNQPPPIYGRAGGKEAVEFSGKSGNICKGGVMEYYAKKKSSSNKYSASLEDGSDHSRHQLYSLPHYSLTPFVPIPHRGPLIDMRYPSSTHAPSSQSGESISMTYCFEPPYAPSPQFHHAHSPSADSSYLKVVGKGSNGGGGSGTVRPSSAGFRTVADDMIPDGYRAYEGGTFPRKKENNQRFRIPSNPSVASKSSGGKLSTGSIEKTSERSSPMPTFHVEVLSPGSRQNNKRSSLPDYCWPHKPFPGELRRVHIDKSVEPLGIQIQCLDSGGVFVSTINKHSLASQVGLQVGDQLLEVCGINMRSATYQLAANVLRQCGNSITMLVQYNPDKYNAVSGSESPTTSGEEDSRSDTRSGSPTPCNSPGTDRKTATPSTLSHSPYTITTLTRPKLTERNEEEVKQKMQEPRYLSMETRKCSNLGISLVGGNAVGIYVHSVTANSVAYNAGLRMGDRILEYNGTNLRQATAEEAAFELAKPADKVMVLVQNELDRYNHIKDKPGDSFYVRAMFDRTGDLGGTMQLQFHKDDVLFVDNTMYNGVPGSWKAWLVDQDGFCQHWGIIPSKYKVEEELLLKRSLGDVDADTRRTTRRSFFRRKKHQRSDSKELASFSSINLGWFSDSGSLNEDTTLASYQKVTRLNSEPMMRPIIILGPLADCVTEKLLADFPDRFMRCVAEVMHCSQVAMEKGIADGVFVDYRKKGSFFECISVSALKDSFDKNCHCILDVSLASVERLHQQHIHPIVLLIKFKSTKQIKEVKDTRYPLDKISAKAAKEMYEHALKLESEYRHYISAVIPAGVNLAYMCTQLKAAVDLEQSKTLWIPSSGS